MARSSGAVVGPVQGCGGSTVEMLLLEILLFIVELLLMGGTHGAVAASAVTTSALPQSPEGVAPAVEAGQFLVQAQAKDARDNWIKAGLGDGKDEEHPLDARIDVLEGFIVKPEPATVRFLQEESTKKQC